MKSRDQKATSVSIHENSKVSNLHYPLKASIMLFLTVKFPPMRIFFSLLVTIQLCAALTALGDPPATSPRESAEGKPLMTISEMAVGAPIISFALAPAGDIVALGGDDGQIRLWNLATGKVVRTVAAYKEKQYIGCVAFSPNGKKLAFQADDEPVRLWDLEKDVETGRGTEKLSIVDHICFSPDGKLIGIASDSLAYVWNVDANKTWKSDQPASALAFSPDGKTVALGFNTLRLVEAESGRSLKELGKTDGSVTSLTFHSAGLQVLVVDGACPGSTVRLFDIATGKETILGSKIPQDHIGANYSPDGKTIAVSDGKGDVIFWDASAASKVATLSGIHPMTDTLLFTPDGKTLLAAAISRGGDVQIWDASGVIRAKNAIKP
jgi:WD40 repeat protein